MSGEPKTLTLTLEEAMHEHRRRRQAEPYLGDVWMDHDGKWRRKAIAGPGTIHDNWPEAFSESWGVPVVARDEAAELRAVIAEWVAADAAYSEWMVLPVREDWTSGEAKARKARLEAAEARLRKEAP